MTYIFFNFCKKKITNRALSKFFEFEPQLKILEFLNTNLGSFNFLSKGIPCLSKLTHLTIHGCNMSENDCIGL